MTIRADRRGAAPILAVRDLTLSFDLAGGRFDAVRGVSFDLLPGEILGIVGESGSGKSLTLSSLIGLAPTTPRGSIRWQGTEICRLEEGALNRIRGREIAMIFQEPMSALNPVLTIAAQIDESLKAHGDLLVAARRRRALDLLKLVGIPGAADRLDDFPHQFSGGMRQRAMIAIALAAEPKLLLADEPTTALDVTIQAQILALIRDLSRRLAMSVILVTHDLGVVLDCCDRVAVMYAGQLVETGTIDAVMNRPRHPYTKGLLESVPGSHPVRTPLFSIPGSPPGPGENLGGCAFAPRCARATARCVQCPPLMALDGDQMVRCWHPVALA